MTNIRRKQQYHGLIINRKKHPIYKIRERILMYCYSIKENHKAYPYYKGKGIIMYQEWIDNIMAFYNWCIENGWSKGLVIDRIDSNGNYEPSNCRFITRSENSKKARAENDQRGMNAPGVILDDYRVSIIKSLIKLNCSVTDIAKLFKVGKSTISNIKNNITWSHVGEYNGNNATSK